ncbi:MAG: nucleoside-diphosphate sugar epimerase/dehydratase [Pseudomonadota bacterium]
MIYDTLKSLTRRNARGLLLTADVTIIAFSNILAAILLASGSSAGINSAAFAVGLLLTIIAGIGLTHRLGLYEISPYSFHMRSALSMGYVAFGIALVGAISAAFAPFSMLQPQLYLVAGLLFLFLAISARLTAGQILRFLQRNKSTRRPILIYGAGQTGQQLASALTVDDHVAPVAFLDDNPRLHGLTIAGLKVHAPSELAALADRHGVGRVVLAMPSAGLSVQREISKRIADTGCEVHALPSFADLVTNRVSDLSETKPVDINDLLGRDRLEEELPGVSETYRGRNIMVTGAGGSIGSELCRQLLFCEPKSLILFDHSEWALFEIHRELQSFGLDIPIHPVLGSVSEKSLVEIAFAKYEIEIVLHAAAYKHVPMVEANALEGIRNNVFGTKNVANAAMAAGVDRFILVSTDKAVRPTSMMGASKRVAEMTIQDLATRSKTTRFSMVRFGNVMGSSGSVIPLFQEQIARGGPVTLTHKDVTRFFMTIPEAVSLVLLTGSFARGGDVFVLDMGEPVKIASLAKKMIENSGLTVRDASNPNGDIEIAVTGLRPGEKLHEELLIGSDMLTTPHPKILRAQETHLSEIEMANVLQSLRIAVDTRDVKLLHNTLDQWIEQEEGVEKIKSVNE